MRELRTRRAGRGAGITGRLGEAMAARYLETEGWSIVERRWRDGPRELDLIAVRREVLIFVEVKTRRSEDLDGLLQAVTSSKRKDLQRAAGAWLMRFGSEFARFSEIRFDVMGVQLLPGEKPRFLHIEGAWQR